jgi:hypothetical protein
MKQIIQSIHKMRHRSTRRTHPRRKRKTRRVGGDRLPVLERLAKGESVAPADTTPLPMPALGPISSPARSLEMTPAKIANATAVMAVIADVVRSRGIVGDDARVDRILRDYADALEHSVLPSAERYRIYLETKIAQGKL